MKTMTNLNEDEKRLMRDMEMIQMFDQDPEFRMNFMHKYGLTEDQAYEEMKLMRAYVAEEFFGYDANRVLRFLSGIE